MNLDDIMPPDDGLPDVSEFMAARPVREGENWTFAPGDRVQVKATDADKAVEPDSTGWIPIRIKTALDHDGDIGWVHRSIVGCTRGQEDSPCFRACGLIYVKTEDFDIDEVKDWGWWNDPRVLRVRVDQVVHID